MEICIMNESIMITGEWKINAFRLLQLRKALQLQIKGMRMSSKGPSALTVIKKEFGLKGNSKKVLEQFTNLLIENGIIND